MRKLLFWTAVGVLGTALTAFGQTPPAGDKPVMGRGRGGAPYAWNDRDKDGICDLTGKPVGQGRAFAAQDGRRGAGRGPRWGRGGRCCRNAAANTPASPAAPAK